MKTINFSKSSKRNKALNSIYEDLLQICDTEAESINDINRYVNEYPAFADYKIYKDGNLLITYQQIRNLYNQYKSLRNVSNNKIEDIYMRQVRFVANYILSNH